MGRAHISHGEWRNPCRIFVKVEGKRSLGIPVCKCQDNIKIHLRGLGWSGMDYSGLAQVGTIGGLL
jgi:hypothetical protein